MTLAASRGDDDPAASRLLARAYGGRRALEAAFVRFARTAVDDPLVGRALRARRTAPLRAGGRLVLRARVQPLGFRLWRVPTGAKAVTDARAAAPPASAWSCAAASASARRAARRRADLGRAGSAARARRSAARQRRAGRASHAHRVTLAVLGDSGTLLGDLHGGGCNLQKSAYARAVPAERSF